MLWELFVTFLMIGFISFGGGYAMIPVIEREVSDHGWMSSQQFLDAIAVAGMSPGPIATNSAIFVGYETAGVPGAAAAAAGMVLPSFAIVVLVASFFYKFKQNRWVKAAFYGLRPIITALIIYGAYRFGRTNGLIAAPSWDMAIPLLIFVGVLFALVKYKVHPFFTIVLSGLIGIAIYH